MKTANDESTSRWYALYLRSRYEKRVDGELRRNNIETFLPLIEEVHHWSDRKKKVIEPLFRGYIFVHSDLRDKETILQTDGVVKFVNIRNVPSPIPDYEIDWVRRIIGNVADIKREQYFEIGERVRVAAGPLMGIEGIVIRHQSDTRVVISLSAINQSISIQVPGEILESF